jgi:hypothetical protein
MKKGMLSPEAITEVKSWPLPASGNNHALEEGVCRKCPFRANDCDFRSKSPPLDAEPCGAYILLALLSAKGVVSMESLKEIADG